MLGREVVDGRSDLVLGDRDHGVHPSAADLDGDRAALNVAR
jgi:hypothetical protein